MGLLDELKKLTKPYDDEDYLEEDLAEPVRAPGRAADARSYAAYAEAPRSAEPAQPATRRPYVFSNQRSARQPSAAADPYAQDYGYAQQPGYAQQGFAPDPYARQGYAPDPYAQPGYSAPSRQGSAAQPRLLLVHPDRFEQAADIADRIAERNAIVLNLETAPKDLTRRMLDFLSGVTYALGGKVKKVSGSTYIITPAGMDFMGDSADGVESREKYF